MPNKVINAFDSTSCVETHSLLYVFFSDTVFHQAFHAAANVASGKSSGLEVSSYKLGFTRSEVGSHSNKTIMFISLCYVSMMFKGKSNSLSR